MAKIKTNSWMDKYDVNIITPGIIIHPSMGEIDLRKSDLPIETLDRLAEESCPFIKLKVIAVESAIVNQ